MPLKFNTQILFGDVTIGEHFYRYGIEYVKLTPSLRLDSNNFHTWSNCITVPNKTQKESALRLMFEDRVVSIAFPEE